MPNTKKFAELTREVRANTPRMAQVNVHRRTMEAMLKVTQAREDRANTADEIANAMDAWEAMNFSEAQVALYLSTLRSYVEELGGELDVTARFPDGETVRIA